MPLRVNVESFVEDNRSLAGCTLLFCYRLLLDLDRMILAESGEGNAKKLASFIL